MGNHQATSDEPARMFGSGDRLRFDRFEIDPDRGVLLVDGQEHALRPKTFAVLRHLARSGGRLVTKRELFDAVWPNLVVTDDVLVQSVSEIRRALGDEAQRLVKTVPRRGYRLVPVVSIVGQRLSPPNPVAPATRSPASWAIVASLAALALASIVAVPLFDTGGRRDVEGAVGGTVHAGASPAPAIAVLPFRNVAGDAQRDYFVDGLTQDLQTALGRFPELIVMSWNAVAPYEGTAATPRTIARDLGVAYQVEGSVASAGDRLRVVARLVDSDGRVLWSSTYDEALAHLSTLNDRMTNEIAGALAIRVTSLEERKALAKPAERLDAYDLVLRARPALQRPTRANNAEARALLRRAIESAPQSAAAHAALAETYHVAVAMGWAESPAESLRHAESLADLALSLDESDVRAHVVLGRVHLHHQRYDQARVELDRAIAINPSNASGLAGLGNALLWLGDSAMAIEFLERAERIDPELNAIDRFALALAYYLSGRYDAAIEDANRNLRNTGAAGFNRVLLAASYAQLGRAAEAQGVATIVRREQPVFDSAGFGNKLRRPEDLAHLREGLRKSGLLAAGDVGRPPP